MDVDKNIRFSLGLILSLIIIAIPMFGWKAWYSFEELSTAQALSVSLAKIGAFGGISMFAVSLILSGRYTFFEKLFGGLDKVYITHRFYGTAGLVLLVVHPIALNIFKGNGITQTLELLSGINDIFILLGAVSLYGFIALIVWSVVGRSSYETFLKLHKFLGALFIIGVIHAYVTGSVLSSSIFLFVYLGILSVLAILTYVFYTLLGDVLHTVMHYKIIHIRKVNNDIIEVILKPKTVHIKFSPGQFVYISFPTIDTTYHPFSIASGRLDGALRLAVRESGDFTKKMEGLKIGANALVKGPYGGFTFFQNRHKKQLWIAGGIGVTPFLSGARSLRNSREKGRIEMIYASEEKYPYGLKELERIEEQNPSFNVTHFHREKFGHVSLEVLQDQLKDLHERAIYLCGPPVMMDILNEEAKRLGLQHNIQFEEFTYK